MSLLRSYDNRYPSYTKNYYQSDVKVLWYDETFSQSRYTQRHETSKACTLICLLVAHLISEARLLIYDVEEYSTFTNIITKAMIKGNAIHERSIREGLIYNPFLNIEEALELGGRNLSSLREWTFQIFNERIEIGLYQHISSFLQKWYAAARSTNLFMFLITCGRTVLFIFQEETYMVTFFDSHSHSTPINPGRGLVVAQTSIDKLDLMCEWYIEDIVTICYNAEPDHYELAFLYPYNVPSIQSTQCCGCNSLCNCGNCCKKHKHDRVN